MRCCWNWVGRPSLVASALWAFLLSAGANAQEQKRAPSADTMTAQEMQRLSKRQVGNLPRGTSAEAATAQGMPSPGASASLPPDIPWDELPEAVRDHVRRVMDQPTIAARGPVEVFRGAPAIYHWLLDHPDRGVQLWRRLGAKCTEILDRGNGRYGWTDKQGSDVHWDTVHRGPHLRIWYVEGDVVPGPLLSAVPVRAVVVLRYAESSAALDRTLFRHRADLYLQTDSKTAALIARLLGPSAPQLARKYVGQMELFFSGLVWYIDQRPEQAEALLLHGLPAEHPKSVELHQMLSR